MTAQIEDAIIYNGNKLFMAADPLAEYLKKVILPHKLVAPHTACWRGYHSTWAIDNKKLFLIEWRGYILNYQKVGIDFLFPGEEFVFADWFTGEIIIPLGDEVVYIYSDERSVSAGEMILEFKDGVLVKEVNKWLTNEEIKNIKEEAKRIDALLF